MPDHSHRLNLTDTNSSTPPIQVPPGAAKLSIAIADASGFTWGLAVVDLQFSLSIELDEVGTDLTNFVNVSPAVQFVTGTRFQRAISVTGYGNVRLKVTTVGSAADRNALVTIVKNWNA